MVTMKQHTGVRKNIKKAQAKWASMTGIKYAVFQQERISRASPGTTGEGNYFRIVVRPKEQFTSFRYHNVGEHGHTLRLFGKRSSGSRGTQTWLISKRDVHRADGSIIADSADVRNVIKSLESVPGHVKGDLFEAKDRKKFRSQNSR